MIVVLLVVGVGVAGILTLVLVGLRRQARKLTEAQEYVRNHPHVRTDDGHDPWSFYNNS